MPQPETQLAKDLVALCEKHGIDEYVFVGWGNDNSITVAHNAIDRPTTPMIEIYKFAKIVAEQVQRESRSTYN